MLGFLKLLKKDRRTYPCVLTGEHGEMSTLAVHHASIVAIATAPDKAEVHVTEEFRQHRVSSEIEARLVRAGYAVEYFLDTAANIQSRYGYHSVAESSTATRNVSSLTAIFDQYLKEAVLQRAAELRFCVRAESTGVVHNIDGRVYGSVNLYQRYQVNQTNENRAAQISNVLRAAESHARKNQLAILNGQTVAGFSNPKAPTLEELAAAGSLAQGYADRGVGGQIKVAINIEPSGCTGAKCQMLVRTYLASSVTDKAGQPDMATASAIAGAIAGGSGWTTAPGDNAHIIRNKVLMPNPLGSTPAVVVAQLWIGSSTASATVPPLSYETNTVADCPYGGTTTYQRTVSTDKWGAVSYGSWSYLYDSCASPPPPPPPPPTVPVVPDPTPPQDPTPVVTPPVTTTPTGPQDPPVAASCSNGATNYPTCTLSGGGDPTSGVCSNGATNYPTCTFAPAPDPIVMVNCPTTVQTVFTSTAQNSVCWNQMSTPLSPQVQQGQQCQYGQPEILNYGVRGGMVIGGNGCQFE